MEKEFFNRKKLNFFFGKMLNNIGAGMMFLVGIFHFCEMKQKWSL